MSRLEMTFLSVLTFFALVFSPAAFAKTVRYELLIRNEPVNLSGKKTVNFALTVNGGIPAPTLEFTEGDDAEILVKNGLSDEEVSIHWHGLLLPPDQDGVPYVNTPPIFAGRSHLFKFKIRQNGTYWYHSHTMLQEQKGVYGGIIIHPKTKRLEYDKDAVVVLSDWSDENADSIIRNLRKDGDYYQYKKDSVRSYFGALSQGTQSLKNHFSNEWIRMGGMDLSDVGYDAFLINGKPNSELSGAKPGERVRLRLINAGSSSYFYIAMAEPMEVVSADGIDIKPIRAKEILIGMAETYDVIVTVPENKSLELRATAQDVTGTASLWIGTGEKVLAPEKPVPDLYATMDHGSGGHAGHAMQPAAMMDHSKMDHSKMDHGAMQPAPMMDHSKMDHSKMDHSKMNHAGMNHEQMGASAPAEPTGSAAPVESLTVNALAALQPTTLPKDAPVHELKLVLGGDMERYVWHINGKAVTEDRLLYIKEGEVVRFTFVNETMMHHPMHLHGHFFRVLTEKGELSPLKHTVDVSPHMTRTIEFYANESGQWMLHCHNLYHMDSGMARVVRYKDFKLDEAMQIHDKHDPHTHEHLYTYGALEAASNHASAQFKLMRTWDELDLQLESAQIEGKNFAYDKPWETEGDLYYRRWFGNWLNVFGGGSLYDEEGYATVGVGYILPLLIDVAASVNHEGKFRFDLERKFQWTKTLFSDADFTWRPNWGGERDTEFEVSLMYGSQWHWAAGLMFTEKSAGVGAQVQF
jgi:CopA family copper-resistance protein